VIHHKNHKREHKKHKRDNLCVLWSLLCLCGESLPRSTVLGFDSAAFIDEIVSPVVSP
jgi:hypothetical protein